MTLWFIRIFASWTLLRWSHHLMYWSHALCWSQFVCGPIMYNFITIITVKVKVIPEQAEEAQGVPGRLMPRIFLTFGTTGVVGRQPYAPAAFTPGEIPGTHFQRLSRPQGTRFCREPRTKSPGTTPGFFFCKRIFINPISYTLGASLHAAKKQVLST